MADTPPETPPPVISPETLREIFSGPAIQSNRVFLTMTTAGVRLTFVEIFGEAGSTPIFRSAVLLSYSDALELRNLISRKLADIEADLKSFIEANPPPEGKHG